MTDRQVTLFSLTSLLLVMTIGILMRLQFAGFSLPILEHFDLRQAHSHLGFYGFLIPLTWVINQISFEEKRQPTVLLVYFVATFMAFVSFLVFGYNWLSHVLSAVVFATWIYQSFKLKKLAPAFQKYMQLSSVLALASLVFVIVGQKLLPATPKINFVHGFISNIILFIVLPTILFDLYKKFPILLWSASVILNYLFEIQILHFLPVNIGLIILGSIILVYSLTFIKINFSFLRNVNFYFTLLGAGIIFSGIWPRQLGYNLQIASLHFCFLTIFPIYYFELYLKYRYSFLFANLGIAMCIAITFLDYSWQYFRPLQFIIAVIGLALLIIATHIIFTTKGHVLQNK